MKLQVLKVGLATLLCTSAVYASEVRVTLNNSFVSFPNGQPRIVQGRTLVPVRGLFDNMGYDISWEAESKTVTLSKEGSDIVIHIGDDFLTVNGKEVSLDVPARIIDSSTMLPLRAISDATGAVTLWNSDYKTASVVERGIQAEYPQRELNLNTSAEKTYVEAFSQISKKFNEDNKENVAVLSKALKDGDISSLSSVSATFLSSLRNTEKEIASLDTPSSLEDLSVAARNYLSALESLLEYTQSYSEGKIENGEYAKEIENRFSNLLVAQADYTEEINSL